jgi:hypothetical protein
MPLLQLLYLLLLLHGLPDYRIVPLLLLLLLDWLLLLLSLLLLLQLRLCKAATIRTAGWSHPQVLQVPLQLICRPCCCTACRTACSTACLKLLCHVAAAAVDAGIVCAGACKGVV